MAKLTEQERQRRALARARREALAAEELHRKYSERNERWQREGTSLTWDEYKAGVPCRGCGKPLTDGRGNWPGAMHLTEDERQEYDAINTEFLEVHGECQLGRWSMDGSRIMHCSFCCPTPPWSERRYQEVQAMLASFQKVDDRDLDEWRLSLICDHVVSRTMHRSNERFTLGVTDCPTCGVRRGIVQQRRLGPAALIGGVAAKKQLAADLKSAKRKLGQQRKLVQEMEARVKRLSEQIRQLEDRSVELQ